MDNYLQLLSEIAFRYYEDDATQLQIAKEFNISRSSVSRYLKDAREMGIVEITVHNPNYKSNHQLETALIKNSKLSYAICATKDSNNGNSKKNIARVAANHLLQIIEKDSVISVASGTTIAEVADSLSTSIEYPDVQFVSMVNSFDIINNNVRTNNVVQKLATKLHARSNLLHAPVIVDDENARNILMEQSFISDVLSLAKKSDIALMGIGGPPNESSLAVAYKDYIDFESDQNFDNIIGDIGYNFFDKKNISVECEWNNRVITIGLEDINNIPNVVCVAEGKHKVESLYSAINGGLINTLITDETTGIALLNQLNEKNL